jgi:rubrerythrin
MIRFTYSVMVTVDNEKKSTDLEKALEAAAKSIGDDVDVSEEDAEDLDDDKE